MDSLSLDGKSLRPTALGEELVKHIPSIITAPDMTAKMELSLMDVEKRNYLSKCSHV